MRASVIGLIVVLTLTAAICILSFIAIEHATTEIEYMRVDVLQLVEAGDREEALMKLTQMAEMWKRHEPTLEMLTSHEDLHDISKLIVESHTTLEVGEADDFIKSMATMGEVIAHIRREEELRLSNIL